MLKIKAPISLICREDFLSDQDNFNERIRMNYGILHSGIMAEDLLHVATTPPQLFLGEGGVTNLVSQMNVENNQIRKVDIINNFMNRIMVSADANLTYQDRVYITSVLHQLGIHDDKTFMQEVFRLQEETENTVNLVNLYWNNMNEIREMVQEYRSETFETQKNIEETTEENRLQLYQEIYNRLQTGAIYQIMQNYHRNEAGVRTVTNNEYQVIEQGRIAQNMLLQRLENIARFENTPLVYRHENIYEGDQVEETEVTESTVNTQLTSAVLLNLIDNLYNARYESTNHNVKNWYSFEDTFYGSSDNTIQRIMNNTALLQYLHETSRQEISVTEQREQETNLVLQLLENRRYEGDEFEEIINAGNIENLVSSETRNEEFLHYLQQNNLVQEIEGDTTTQTRQILQQFVDEHQQIRQDRTEQVDLSREETVLRQEFRQEGDQVVQEGDTFVSRKTEGDTTTQNRQILQQFIDEHKLIRQDRTEQVDRSREETVLHQEFRQEGDQVIHEGDTFEQAETNIRVEPRTFEEKNLIEENYENIAQNIDRIYQQNLMRREEYLASVERFVEEEKVKLRPVGGKKKTIEQSLNALTNPKEFMERFQEEAAAERQREEAIREAAARILPRDRAQGLNLIQQFLENPERVELLHLLEHTSETQLMSEVFDIERDRTERITDKTTEERVTDRVAEKVTERIVNAAAQRGPEVTAENESIRRTHLVHRDVSNTIDEDLAEELLEQRHLLEETNRRIEQTVKNEETHSMKIVNTVNDQVVQEAPKPENISRMIDQGIKAQVDTISEKVYNKLERRLSNEKIRRGF